MKVLYGTMLLTFIIAYLSGRRLSPSNNPPYYERPQLWGYIGVAVIMSLVSGLRSYYVDTQAYMANFANLDYADPLMPRLWEIITENRDFGFGLLSQLLRQITDDPQILIFTCALITNLLFVKVFFDYAEPFELAIFLYMATDIYLSSMNGMRQYMASAIVFAGIKWLIEGKWQKFFLVVLLAATIHQSAIIMIPIYFLVRQPAWKKVTVTATVAGVAGFFALPYIFPQIEDFLGENDLTKLYADNILNSDFGSGANYLWAIVALVPVVLAFISRHRLHQRWPGIDIIVNMSILNVFFYLIGTYSVIFARLNYYTLPFSVLLICFLATHAYERRTEKIFRFCVVALYFIYFWFWSSIKMNFIYKSDFLGIVIS